MSDQRCPAYWPPDEHHDGRQCRFILEEEDGRLVCPAHGEQRVPETVGESNEQPETEQVTLVE